jgi:hypothetical protein
MKRNRERGSAMIVTLIVTTALLAGAAVLASMQINATRSADLVRTGLSSTYCAEAGLSAARPVVANNYASWSSALATYPSTAEPAWLSTGIGSHDLDHDGVDDFVVYIKDNDDEFSPNVNDYTHDNDQRVFIVSRCIKYTDTVHEVEELVEFNGGGNCYKTQLAGCGGNGNTNQ